MHEGIWFYIALSIEFTIKTNNNFSPRELKSNLELDVPKAFMVD